MRISVSTRDRERLVRVLRVVKRDDGLADLTFLRLDPGQNNPVLMQTVPANAVDAIADGAPVFDTRGSRDFPQGFWPARRTAGGWIAVIDENFGIRKSSSAMAI